MSICLVSGNIILGRYSFSLEFSAFNYKYIIYHRKMKSTMKKLILHIGYHKTATTTLQDNAFYNLFANKNSNFDFLLVSDHETYGL
jgi:hypothetical protein